MEIDASNIVHVPDYTNIVKLNFDLYREDWSTFSHNIIDVVHVDALHDYHSVGLDIRNVLSMPCCVHTIVFHDRRLGAILRFVSACILREQLFTFHGDLGGESGVACSLSRGHSQ